jgi:hypothetical protein
VFADFRVAPTEKLPTSQTCQRSLFPFLQIYYTTFRIFRRFASGMPIRPLPFALESICRFRKAASGVPLEGGQAHRVLDRKRLSFVLTTLARAGVDHPRIAKEPDISFIFIVTQPFPGCRRRRVPASRAGAVVLQSSDIAFAAAVGYATGACRCGNLLSEPCL